MAPEQIWKRKSPSKERVRVERIWPYRNLNEETGFLEDAVLTARCHPVHGGKPLVIPVADLEKEFELETYVPVSTLEVLVQELEERAEKALSRRDSFRLGDPKRWTHERVAEANRSAAQLVRAEIEEGEARG